MLKSVKESMSLKNKSRLKTERKRGRKMGWIIALFIVAIVVIIGVTKWSSLMKEHQQAKNLPINMIEFSNLKDGTYIGEYEGGMYKWRTNKVEVTVASGKVTGIKLIGSSDPGKENTKHNELYNRVIDAQSLQVDTISGATLTSKAYLKAIENALAKAQ